MYVTLEHKSFNKSLVYICSNSQKYMGQNDIFVFAKNHRTLSKDHIPWRYLVNFLL